MLARGGGWRLLRTGWKGGIERSFRGEQVSPEGCDAECGDDRSQEREEEPAGVEQERVTRHESAFS